MKTYKLILLILTLFLNACSNEKDSDEPKINIISSTINGSNITANVSNVEIDPQIVIVFDVSISPESFEKNLSITQSSQPVNYSINFQNASSRVVIDLNLDYEKTYNFRLTGAGLGASGQSLAEPIAFQFTTVGEGIITKQSPCSSATSDCLSSKQFSDGEALGSIEYYSNYPLFPDNARWEEIEYAVIVIHGANRNFDDYFTWVNGAIEALGMSDKTILISPQFKDESESSSDNLYWNSNNWREGDKSTSSAKISSFSIIDSMASQLGNTEVFPKLKKIIITGHSSGGLFTHVYGAANNAETNDIEMTYVVANSQYFYYPDGQRVNQGSQTLFTPTSCNGYETWPLGYNLVPEYVSSVGKEQLDNQFQHRRIFYLLGNGSGSDGAFNNSNCAYELLGESRYLRGENMFTYMGLKFNSHSHERYIVEGIGHNGQGMYASSEFSTLLSDLLGSN